MKHLVIALFSLTFLVGCGKTDAQPITPPVPALKVLAKATTSQPELPTEKESPKPEATTNAIAKKPGTVLWEFETGNGVSSSPAIGSDGTVYVGSYDNKLYAIKTDSKGLAKSPWPMRGQNARHTGRVLEK